MTRIETFFKAFMSAGAKGWHHDSNHIFVDKDGMPSTAIMLRESQVYPNRAVLYIAESVGREGYKVAAELLRSYVEHELMRYPFIDIQPLGSFALQAFVGLDAYYIVEEKYFQGSMSLTKRDGTQGSTKTIREISHVRMRKK